MPKLEALGLAILFGVCVGLAWNIWMPSLLKSPYYDQDTVKLFAKRVGVAFAFLPSAILLLLWSGLFRVR